jgi:hypothetical protein
VGVTNSSSNEVRTYHKLVDSFNRQLGDLLGMPYTFRTTCFETRLSEHFLFPVTYVNAVNAATYHLTSTYGGMQTKPMLMTLASMMVRNPGWMWRCATAARTRRGRRERSAAGGSPQRALLVSGVDRWRAALARDSDEAYPHPARAAGRLQGSEAAALLGVQQALLLGVHPLQHRHVRWAALHPPVTQGSKQKYGCLAAHRCNPAGGYKVTTEVLSGTSATSKRRRRVPVVVL